jgi:hypothetical protein
MQADGHDGANSRFPKFCQRASTLKPTLCLGLYLFHDITDSASGYFSGRS